VGEGRNDDEKSQSGMTVARPEEARPDSMETIEELFAALESPLLNYALRLAQERSAAEDIVQDAFMKLHSQFEQVREPRRWLYRTVHNLALNHLRQAGKLVPLTPPDDSESPLSRDLPDGQLLPDEQIARWEGIGLVRLSLNSLDERSREVVRLKFNEGLSYNQISEQTGLTTGHVGYLLHHALKAIAAELAKSGVIP
jgi:RNA polymerase sigma factor (sigma-70 family)